MANGPAVPSLEPARSAVDYLSETVARHFKVHHIEGDRFRLAFFTRETAEGARVESDSPAVDRAFDALRVEVKPHAYIATLQLVGGDGIVTVSRVVDPPFRSSRVNWAFFILTLFSVQSAGALLWAAYISPHGPTGLEPGVDWLSAEAQAGGFLFFAAPLMAVLGLHEMGHFFTARHYHIRASLPFFIPSLPPLGTFGAFISMRDPLPSRRVIFDIGLSGPLVGFVASIGVTVVGAFLMQGNPSPVRPEVGGSVNLGSPLMFDWILGAVGSPENSYLHPTLFAGWAGFLVTAFNLIPAAQLDGGHVFFSLIRNGPNRESRAVLISIASVLGIAVLGSLLGYNGWLLLIVIVFLTIRHPPPLNQISALGWKRLAAGLAAVLVFAVSFSPAPIQLVFGDYAFEVVASEAPVEVPAGGFANYSFTVQNRGNTFNELVVEVHGAIGPFTAAFGASNTSTTVRTNLVESVNATVNASVVALTRLEGQMGAVYLLVRPAANPSLVKPVYVRAVTTAAHPAVTAAAEVPGNATPGSIVDVPIVATNTGDVPLNLTFGVSAVFSSWAETLSFGFGSLTDPTAVRPVDPGADTTVIFVVQVPSGAGAGTNTTFIVQVFDETWPGAGTGIPVEIRVAA